MYSLELILLIWVCGVIGGLSIGFTFGRRKAVKLYGKQMDDILKSYAEDQYNYENEDPDKYNDA